MLKEYYYLVQILEQKQACFFQSVMYVLHLMKFYTRLNWINDIDNKLLKSELVVPSLFPKTLLQVAFFPLVVSSRLSFV